MWAEHRHEWTVEAQLARFGRGPEDIHAVINTCCHFDHIGNNTKFPNVRFIVQKLELPLAIHARSGPSTTTSSLPSTCSTCATGSSSSTATCGLPMGCPSITSAGT